MLVVINGVYMKAFIVRPALELMLQELIHSLVKSSNLGMHFGDFWDHTPYEERH